MIHVIASIRVRGGQRSAFLEIFKANVPNVREEKGCIAYFPTVDIDADLAPQSLDETIVTIIETWENVAALRDHLNAPHMLSYKEKVKDTKCNIRIKQLRYRFLFILAFRTVSIKIKWLTSPYIKF